MNMLGTDQAKNIIFNDKYVTFPSRPFLHLKTSSRAMHGASKIIGKNILKFYKTSLIPFSGHSRAHLLLSSLIQS